MLSFGENPMDSPIQKLWPLLGNHTSLCMAIPHECCLSRKILNILYDRHGPNPGFLILRTFEHLNSKT